MNFVAVFLVSLAIINSSKVEGISFLPTLFVTKSPEKMLADESRVYGVTVCKPSQYSNYTATAYVNIPLGWNPIIGMQARIDLCIDMECQKILSTNFPGDKFNGNHFVNISYVASYGDLFIRTTAGRSSYIDWTVAVDFTKKGQHNPLWERRAHLKEYMNIKSIIPKATGGVVETLSQIVKTATVQTVKTLAAQEFLLYFCPDRQTTLRYDIVIATTATDAKSAMATYICTKPDETCTVNTAIAYDPSGTGVNTVTLHTASATISGIRVLVVGYGDGQQTNSFQLSAKLRPK